MGVLTQEQHLQFETEGYLLAPGLIPDDISERAEDRKSTRLNSSHVLIS